MTDIERIRSITEFLEGIARDRSALRDLSEGDRVRFLNAAGDVFCPDVEERRRRVRARRRQERDERAERTDAARAETGIRRLRAKPVYTTPNVFAPRDVDVAPSPPIPEPGGPLHCYVCRRPCDPARRRS